MTNAEARCNKSLRPRKPEGSLGRTAQDVHLDSHTAPELWPFRGESSAFINSTGAHLVSLKDTALFAFSLMTRFFKSKKECPDHFICPIKRSSLLGRVFSLCPPSITL